jgi:hypothetical protein
LKTVRSKLDKKTHNYSWKVKFISDKRNYGNQIRTEKDSPEMTHLKP